MNAISANGPGLPKSIRDLQHDACMLHAFAQGVAELHDTLKTDTSPASNAMPALFESLIERADRLSNELDALQTAMRRAELEAQA